MICQLHVTLRIIWRLELRSFLPASLINIDIETNPHLVHLPHCANFIADNQHPINLSYLALLGELWGMHGRMIHYQ